MDKRLQHAVFASKKVIQRGLCDASRFADLAYGGRVVSLHCKQVERRAQNALGRRCLWTVDDFVHGVRIPTGKYTPLDGKKPKRVPKSAQEPQTIVSKAFVAAEGGRTSRQRSTRRPVRFRAA